MLRTLLFLFFSLYSIVLSAQTPLPRTTVLFNDNWKFSLGEPANAHEAAFADKTWRTLDVPHDWSIEGKFDEKNPAGVGGGALPGGIGWYRKSFALAEKERTKKVFMQFDGIYRNSEVWINGHALGKRPNGYISFRYELTPYLKYGAEKNVIAVKVDNSKQPNSRWYSGAGIYRNVWLITTSAIYVDQWGTFVQTPEVSGSFATVSLQVNVRNTIAKDQTVDIQTTIRDPEGNEVGQTSTTHKAFSSRTSGITQSFTLRNPKLWSVDKPDLYKAVTQIIQNKKVIDVYETTFGIRYFNFDVDKGFSLNGKPMKINGVCLHHDLGCLGAAFNTRAMERQLEIMRGMGVNGIRTSHNPPAPELLDLCDKMGFIVMDEMFDMWKKKKSDFDYSLDWDAWHERDLKDFIIRDRNHPSVMIWSVGNEIGEQWDSTGVDITKELVSIVKSLDASRPVTTANNEIKPYNNLIKSGALDIIGYNYNHKAYADFQKDYPGKKFIATETTSALATRGHYDMPSDSIRRWPIAWDKPFIEGNADNTVSAYDNVSAPWGSTHEETLKVMKKHDFLSGMFIWTGFDYLGEPTPYTWPSRSSYFGVVDLAGFPKDAYYLYQSEWTGKPVLHIYPHWNLPDRQAGWKAGQTIDVWAYYNQADEVELFLNGKSQGVKRKQGDDLHVMWRLKYQPGTLKAVSRKNGKEVLVKEVKTANSSYTISLKADRTTLHANGSDLSFITVEIQDDQGTVVPYAENLIRFKISGEGSVAGVDNGDPVSHDSFQAHERKAFHGLCLLVVRSSKKSGTITVEASADGLISDSLNIETK
ncbi:MAG TPA: beta-galactosidase GalB [Ohtaekwangia sp.]